MRSGIVCCGVSCLDLFLYGTEPLPTRESLVMVTETRYRAGGATSNTGHALSRLGMPADYFTVIGDDANGDILLDLWARDGIDSSHVVRTAEAGTAVSVVPVYADGKRGVYHCPGANDLMGADNLFGPDRRYLDVLRRRLAFHLGYPPLLRRMQGADLADLVSLVRETGVLVSLDTTPVPDDTTLHGLLAPALPLAHLFMPNVMEASQVVGRFTNLAGRAREASARAGEPMEIEDVVTPDELVAMGERLLGEGLPIVVITLGPNGAFVCTAGEGTLRAVPCAPADLGAWADQRLYVPACEVDGPINTAGAGDTFAAAVLVGLCRGLPSMEEIVKLAHCVGALHCDLSRGACSFEEAEAALPAMKPRRPRNPHLPEAAVTFGGA
jgi:sugar/nucleoside kinase (ribokinase family)